jgi:hypothetical protein
MDNYDVQNNNQNGEQLEKPMTLGEWIITMIVLAIPCVGIVMMFVWGFGQGGNTSRKNYCRAALIFAAIGIVLGLIFYGAIAAMMASAFSSYSY